MNPSDPFAARDGLPATGAAALLDTVMAAVSDAVVVTDPLGRVVTMNPAAERLFGHSAGSLLGRPIDRLLPEDQRAAHRSHLADGLAAGRPPRQHAGAASRPHGPAWEGGRVVGQHADGHALRLDSWLATAEVDGEPRHVAFFRDAAAQASADRARGGERLALAELSQRLLRQEEETARRLGKALHDGLAQTLAAIRLMLDAGAHGKLDALVTEADDQVRQALVALRPALLDEHGLAAALREELHYRTPLHAGVEMAFNVEAGLAAQRWPADVEYAALMVGREAFHNAWRHAGASRIQLTLAGDADRLRLSVHDDGRGLPSEHRRRARPGHFGVIDMHERAQAVGAALTLASTAGAGTQVHFVWPAPPESPTLGTPNTPGTEPVAAHRP